MVKVALSQFRKYSEKIRSLKIAVVGDVMLDVYYWGITNRISPEAPVPVVDVYSEEVKPGGAANVALNIKTLGAEPLMYGIIGNDLNGSDFEKNILSRGISTKGLLTDNRRPTTVKTRILASNQHVVRFDRENSENINSAAEKKLLKLVFSRIDEFDAIIFQDYNKGLLTPGLIKPIIKKAKEKNIITAVDPKFKNYSDYEGTCIFKPNLREAEEILNRKISSEKDIERAGHDLIKMLKLEKLVITLSSKGMAVFDSSSKMEIIPARSAKISNVSGAGDTVIATLVSYLCAGASYKEACTIANYAASLAVEDVSVIAIDPTELEKRLKDNGVSGAENRHDSGQK